MDGERLSDDELAAIAARAEAATAGPWEVGNPYSIAGVNDGSIADWQAPANIPRGKCSVCVHSPNAPLVRTISQPYGQVDKTGNYHVHRMTLHEDDYWQPWRKVTSAATLAEIAGTYDYDAGGIATTRADAEFVAHARTDVPRLLAEVARLRAVEAAATAYVAAQDAEHAFWLRDGADGMSPESDRLELEATEARAALVAALRGGR